MKKKTLRKMKCNNPNIFKECWRDRIAKIEYEEQRKLDEAAVRRSGFNKSNGKIIN